MNHNELIGLLSTMSGYAGKHPSEANEILNLLAAHGLTIAEVANVTTEHRLIAANTEAIAPEVLKALQAGTWKAVPVDENEISAASMVASDHDWITYNYFVCCRRCGIVRRADGKNSRCKGNVKITTRTEATLEKLLRMTVHVGPGCIAPEGTQMSPEFRLSIQEITDDGVRFIIHAHGHDSHTMEFIVQDNSLIPIIVKERS